jgi:uncharacterized surface protein with fasciclin (FAS1) repeats
VIIWWLRLEALNGEDLLVTLPPIAVNGNKVAIADIDASNGVVHVIDGVLFPSWVSNSVLDRIIADSDLTTAYSLAVLAGTENAFRAATQITFFAPINSAFDKIPEEDIIFLTSDEGKDDLIDVLYYHALPGTVVVSSSIEDGGTAPTFEGSNITASVGDEGIFINDVKAVEADILANNGVMHKIDTLLIPGPSEPEPIIDGVFSTPIEQGKMQKGKKQKGKKQKGKKQKGKKQKGKKKKGKKQKGIIRKKGKRKTGKGIDESNE